MLELTFKVAADKPSTRKITLVQQEGFPDDVIDFGDLIVARQFLYDTGRAARGAAAFVAGPDVGSGSRPGLTIFVR